MNEGDKLNKKLAERNGGKPYSVSSVGSVGYYEKYSIKKWSDYLLVNDKYLDNVIKNILKEYEWNKEELIDLIYAVVTKSPANIEMVYNYLMDNYELYKKCNIFKLRNKLISLACKGFLREDQ